MKKNPEVLYNLEFFKNRRSRLAALMKPHEVLVLFSTPEYYRNADVHHNHRQDSSLFYLTGFEEAGSIFVFAPGQKSESILFVQKKDPLKETWDGFLFGADGAKEQFAMDSAFENSEFGIKAIELMAHAQTVYTNAEYGTKDGVDLNDVLKSIQKKKGRSGLGVMTVSDAVNLMGQLRVKKTEEEIQMLRKSCQISSEGHKAMMKAVRPGMSERELHGIFLYEIMKRGAQREGYSAIVASGSHATTLHYKTNHDVCQDGEFLLVDAGGEYNYLTADITRTYPVNKKFSPEQRDLYQRVLDVQKTMIAAVKPGTHFKALNEQAISLLVDHMIELKLFKQSKDEIISKRLYVKYYPHSLGHFLGMDVHDLGAYYKSDLSDPIPFEAGNVITIEPGLYIPKDDEQAPKALRGLGVRIEDDILVTQDAFEVLTHDCPKEIADIEAL
jgi:Xaa-Pro aminopeptidase